MGLVADGRSTGTSRPPSSRSCSTNAPAGWSAVAVAGREQPHDLGRVQGSSPPRRDDAPGALVEWLQRPGGRVVDLDDHAPPGGRIEAQHAVARASVRFAQAPADEQHLDPEPGGRERQARDERVDLLRAELDRRPHVEQHTVPLQAPARRAVRLEAADRLEHLDEHPLELRDGDDAPVVVADRGEVAHLGEGEQPLVLGICASDAVEEVDVLGRGQPLEGEVRKSPQVQAVAHHRV